MANELSTAGISIKYAVETTAGTKPSSFATAIPNVVSIGALNGTPDTLDVTDLSDTVYYRYILGLTNLGDTMTLTVNFTPAFLTAWTTLVSAAATGKASGLATWFDVNIPGFGDFYFTGTPCQLGLPEVGVNAVFQGEANIVVSSVSGFTAATP